MLFWKLQTCVKCVAVYCEIIVEQCPRHMKLTTHSTIQTLACKYCSGWGYPVSRDRNGQWARQLCDPVWWIWHHQCFIKMEYFCDFSFQKWSKLHGLKYWYRMAWRLQTLRMLMARGGTEVCRLKYIETCDCSYTFTSYNFMQRLLASTHHPLELTTNLREDFTITEKAPTRDVNTRDGWL